jgi:hypothetical protein
MLIAPNVPAVVTKAMATDPPVYTRGRRTPPHERSSTSGTKIEASSRSAARISHRRTWIVVGSLHNAAALHLLVTTGPPPASTQRASFERASTSPSGAAARSALEARDRLKLWALQPYVPPLAGRASDALLRGRADGQGPGPGRTRFRNAASAARCAPRSWSWRLWGSAPRCARTLFSSPACTTVGPSSYVRGSTAQTLSRASDPG